MTKGELYDGDAITAYLLLLLLYKCIMAGNRDFGCGLRIEPSSPFPSRHFAVGVLIYQSLSVERCAIAFFIRRFAVRQKDDPQPDRAV